MSPVKTSAIILKVIPYRESSYILYLFSGEYGIIHAIAKGVRKLKTGQNFLERGFLIESVLYVKPHRDLHTATNIQVTVFYPDTRKDLIKSALRDTIFEATLLFLTQADPHPDLYQLLSSILETIESNSANKIHPIILWHFFYKTSALLGFQINISSCIQCGDAPTPPFVRLNPEGGGILCAKCSPNPSINQRFPIDAIKTLCSSSLNDFGLAAQLNNAECKRVTFLLADFCRLHFDIPYKFKALSFLNTVTDR